MATIQPSGRADPSVEEVANWENMSHVAAWAQLTGQPDDPQSEWGSLVQCLSLDADNHFRVLGSVDAGEFRGALDGWKFREGNPGFIRLNKALLLHHGCCVAVGSHPRAEAVNKAAEDYLQLQMAQAQAQVPVAARGPAEGQTDPNRTFKISNVADQAGDDDVTEMSTERIDAAFACFARCMGGPPSTDKEPTVAQLSALYHLMHVRKVAPYVDFSVFCPHALRIQRKLKMVGLVFTSSGELMRSEIAGPATFSQWESCYAVFRTAMVMLDAATPTCLDQYHDHIQGYYTRYAEYTDAWPVIYQADTRARRELTERLRRQGAADRKELEDAAVATGSGVFHPFDPANPWKYVWNKLTTEVAFWRKEVEEPALMLSARVAGGAAQITGEAPTARSTLGHIAGGAATGSTPAGAGGGRKRKVVHASKKKYVSDSSGKLWAVNRSGKTLCPGFNDGSCTEWPCKTDPSYVHQCSLCLGRHALGSSECKGPQGAGKGGKAKGKGKKGVRNQW